MVVYILGQTVEQSK